MREIVFDTETTGRDPLTGDRIVEIGCVEIVNLTPTGQTFHRYVNPERDVPEEVVRIHGLTAHFLSSAKPFRDASIVGEFLDFIGDSPLVAHNAEFDRGFLNAELSRLKLAIIPQERCIDTLAIARAKFRGAANSLDALSRRFMLDRDGFDLAARKGAGGHGALVDAKILARVYLELKGGREQALVFEEASAGADDSGVQRIDLVRRAARATPLPSRLTEEEIAAHEAFVAGLGEGALWKRAEAA